MVSGTKFQGFDVWLLVSGSWQLAGGQLLLASSKKREVSGQNR